MGRGRPPAASWRRTWPGWVRAITGEEDPEVLVTLEDTGENVYAADQAWNTQEGGAQNSREEESTYILLKDRDGGQSALPVTQRQPEVRGGGHREQPRRGPGGPGTADPGGGDGVGHLLRQGAGHRRRVGGISRKKSNI